MSETQKEASKVRCQICTNWSLSSFCPSCKTLLNPQPITKNIDGLSIISFYAFDEIEQIIYQKYLPFGDAPLKALAKISLRNFFNNLELDEKTLIIPIDDRPKNFSHTAVIASVIKHKNAKILYGSLHAQNDIKYAGKTKKFRLENARNFRILKPLSRRVILLDDVITTGTSLLEASKCAQSAGAEVLFAITLAYT